MNGNKNEIKKLYNENATRMACEINVRKTRNRLFVAGELVSFCAAVAAFVAWASGGLHAPMLFLGFALLLSYTVVRHFDTLNMRATEHLEALRAYYINEVEALEGRFSLFDDGAGFADTSHAFTFDLDIFGGESLFQRICRCVTPGGKARLARHLSTLPTDKNTVLGRQKAIAEMADMEQWRAEWNCNVSAGLPPVELSSGESVVLSLPSFFSSTFSLVFSNIAMTGFTVSVLLAVLGIIPSSIPILWAIVRLGIVIGVTSSPLRLISMRGEKLLRSLRGYIPLARLLCDAPFRTPVLVSLQQELKDDGDALEAFDELRRILEGYDRRGNLLGMVLFNILFLSDFFLVRRYQRWHSRYAGRVGKWLDAIAETDSLVSMSTFTYNHPETSLPIISDGERVVCEARGLWHPFLGDDAVPNDFTILDRNYYIITGANMAGKSTFLRAIGINYVIAMAGMRVFASEMNVGMFNLFTSMCTTDDLQHGISYFNAELLRLSQLLASVKDNPPCTMIILDEILKGTNSLDKLNGSRMFLEAVSKLPVSGVIATHDLELSRMAESNNRFHNHCFEIELGESVTYGYKITDGVAKNQNATYLLKRILDN
ncbi:MutS-related protein [Prevotella sp. OH937_COT-195]|uniref:MutS-related protein n=1 Tax=Prevotella sp. OH937_COT-195 TaxID=2491051 RepID=UPI000F653A9A|nr:DNA mismatch repair protein MutS [Prevotella sp. OH937_COT-195]RRD02111.1 DNA mismatch repair protein MutS [Prevotella sp. OH937_COT-195]